LSFTINSSHFFYGDFINSLITFVSVAAAAFFFVIKPMTTCSPVAYRRIRTPRNVLSARARSRSRLVAARYAPHRS